MSEQILVATKSGHVKHIASNADEGKTMCGRNWGRVATLIGGVGCYSCRTHEGRDLSQRIEAAMDEYRAAQG